MRRNRIQVFAILALLLPLVLATSGCPKGAYHDAVVAEHQFKEVVKAFQQAEIKEFQNGRIDPAEHQKIEGGVGKIGLGAQTLVTSLQSGAANATVQQNFDTLHQAISDLANNGVLGLKSDVSKQLLKTSLDTAAAILANVGILLHAQSTTTVTGGN